MSVLGKWRDDRDSRPTNFISKSFLLAVYDAFFNFFRLGSSALGGSGSFGATAFLAGAGAGAAIALWNR